MVCFDERGYTNPYDNVRNASDIRLHERGRHKLDLVAMGAEAACPVMRAATGFDAEAHRGQRRDTGHQGMPGHALAIHDVAPVIPSHCGKHALGKIDPEDGHFLLHRTRLLWLKGFTDRERIGAHCRRSAQGRVHFITTRYWGSGKTASFDGTRFELAEQNLLADFHFRYRLKGAVAFHVVSDLYVALFTHFIPPGVYLLYLSA